MENIKYPNLLYRFVFVLGCGLMLLSQTPVTAQDPQFSQFYAAPLYLNPAFAGSTGQARVGMNYRNQWPAIDANFNTISAYADFYLEDINSGVGALITRDREGVLGRSEPGQRPLAHTSNVSSGRGVASSPGSTRQMGEQGHELGACVGPVGRDHGPAHAASGAFDTHHDCFITRVGIAFEAKGVAHHKLGRLMALSARAAVRRPG